MRKCIHCEHTETFIQLYTVVFTELFLFESHKTKEHGMSLDLPTETPGTDVFQ